MNDNRKPLAVGRAVVRAVRAAVGAIVFAGLAFVGAGQFDWARGWGYAAVFVAVSVAGSLIVQVRNPGLLEARARGLRKDTKPFDRRFYRLFLPLVTLYPLLAGADAVRFGWAALPAWTFWPGAALFLVGSFLTTWTMVVNPHAESTVRIQSDRGHTVIDTGPYRFVRHPMYVGTAITLPAGALILGSGWAMLPAALIIALFVWRTAHEDRALRAELPGYDAYAAATRYRLIPGLW